MSVRYLFKKGKKTSGLKTARNFQDDGKPRI